MSILTGKKTKRRVKSVGLSELEHKKLVQLAKIHNTTPSAIIRELIEVAFNDEFEVKTERKRNNIGDPADDQGAEQTAEDPGGTL